MPVASSRWTGCASVSAPFLYFPLLFFGAGLGDEGWGGGCWELAVGEGGEVGLGAGVKVKGRWRGWDVVVGMGEVEKEGRVMVMGGVELF